MLPSASTIEPAPSVKPATPCGVVERAASFNRPGPFFFFADLGSASRSAVVGRLMKRGTPLESSAVAQTKASQDHSWKLQSSEPTGVFWVGNCASGFRKLARFSFQPKEGQEVSVCCCATAACCCAG